MESLGTQLVIRNEWKWLNASLNVDSHGKYESDLPWIKDPIAIIGKTFQKNFGKNSAFFEIIKI